MPSAGCSGCGSCWAATKRDPDEHLTRDRRQPAIPTSGTIPLWLCRRGSLSIDEEVLAEARDRAGHRELSSYEEARKPWRSEPASSKRGRSA